MLKPGTCLCHACGHTSSGLNYYNGVAGESVATLCWDSANKFYLKPFHENDTTIYELIDASEITADHFPPASIKARIGSDPTVFTLHRSCPHCRRDFLIDQIGRVPGYVIAVIGAVGAGKTSWLGALATASLGPLNYQKYPYMIRPVFFNGVVSEIHATEIGDNGNTNFLEIRDKQTDEIVAMIYLLDYGGELYKNQKVDHHSPVGRLLLGTAGSGYTGIDAALVVEPAVSDGSDDLDAQASDLAPTLSRIKGIDRIPIAHVLTFGDKLLAMEMNNPAPADGPPPLFTDKTFPSTVYTGETFPILARHFTPSAIVRRIHLQNYIANRGSLGNIMTAYLPLKNIRHFLVQSCISIDGTTKNNNYRKQFNVVDPLIWLLTQLRLFPLELTNGG